MTRPDPAGSGAEQGVGTHGKGTADRGPRGALVRLGADMETLAVDLLDRLGPQATAALLVALAEALEGLR